VFDFSLGRGRDGPKRFLGQFEGILQNDGYATYDQIGGPRMVHAACWAHAREFFEVVRLNPRDPIATPIVAQMDDLFAVQVTRLRTSWILRFVNHHNFRTGWVPEKHGSMGVSRYRSGETSYNPPSKC